MGLCLYQPLFNWLILIIAVSVLNLSGFFLSVLFFFISPSLYLFGVLLVP